MPIPLGDPRPAFLVVALYTLAWFGVGLVRLFRDESPVPTGSGSFIWFALWAGPSAAFLIWRALSSLKARFTGLQAQAQHTGFEIISRADESFLADVASLRLLTSSGSSAPSCVAVRSQPMPWLSPFSPAARMVFNLMRSAADGARITFFEYADRGTGPGSRDSTGSVIQLHSAHLNLPRFSLSPEGSIDRIADRLSGQDIDFPSHPRFSRMFRLRGSDEAGIRGLFSGRILDFYESHPGLYTEGEGNQLVVYGGAKEWFPCRASDKRVNYSIKPAALEGFVRQALEVYGLFASPAPAE